MKDSLVLIGWEICRVNKLGQCWTWENGIWSLKPWFICCFFFVVVFFFVLFFTWNNLERTNKRARRSAEETCYHSISSKRLPVNTCAKKLQGVNYNIVKIGKNTEKSPWDLRRLPVTQSPVINHLLALVWKTLQSLVDAEHGEWHLKFKTVIYLGFFFFFVLVFVFCFFSCLLLNGPIHSKRWGKITLGLDIQQFYQRNINKNNRVTRIN